ncbi:MAG: prenyltransferase/squalene oxidase repeat-containing protein [Candidatus Methanofastidiosia archaeon]
MKEILKSGYVKLQEGITSGVAYDTAWTARITDQRGNPLFPECVKWVLENQRPDGSWGSQILNYHDRVLSTLSAIMALKEINGKYKQYIKRGEKYIWDNIKNLKLDNKRLIGSELLIPSLMEQAESMGLNLPYHVKIYQREYNAKLKKIDESMWYSPVTTLSFSLEFLGDAVDVERLQNAQLPNGSVATSPAATAFFLNHIRDAGAYDYIKKILSITRDGSVMTVYPIEVFEYGWTLYNLMLAGLYFERYTEICDFLYSHLRHSGLCWSAESPITSLDETAMACRVLCNMHYSIDFQFLNQYDNGDYYVTLASELDPSISTNIHVLDLARNCPEFPEREEAVEKLIHFLKKEMHPDGFWIDKWHVSPYYPTAHAVFALHDMEPRLAEKAISWICDSQNENGMWGKNGGLLEETAHALQALAYYHCHVEPIDIERISEAVANLKYENFLPSIDLANLWIGKVLYSPIRVVWSSVASAHFMIEARDLHIPMPVYGR